MDRLQQAIQKARVERASRKSEILPLADAPPVAPQLPDEQVSDEVPDHSWTALPEIKIEKRIRRRNRLMSYEGGPEAASYDMLRTKMLQQITTNGWRRVALTSASSGCGKSTTTANLAFSLGRQTDLRVMVLDFDMRRMGLAKILNQRGRHSMADVFQGKVPFQEHAVRFGENVIFGLNFAPTRNPSEVIQSGQTIEILEQIEATYKPDIVLFDTPPLLASDDSHGFLRNVDCALLLAAAEQTSMDHIDLSERQLAELTKVMGIVLNKCRYVSKAFGYEAGSY